MPSKNGATADLTPVYIDRAMDIIIPNKVTLAPGDPDREKTILLQPHVGEEGRKKDTDILEFLDRMRKAQGDDADDMSFFTQHQEELYRVAAKALDLSVEELKNSYTLFETAQGFMAAMSYRSGQSAQEAVQAAIKKYREGQEKALVGGV